MIVDFDNNIGEEISIIKFTINFGINQGKVFEFNSRDDPIIKLGRKKSSTVQMVFPDDATSKVQSL